MFSELTELFQAPLSIWEAIIRVGISVMASTIVYILYQIFYGSKHIGAGVNRTFLLGGPAITMIFLIIQTSIPLGLGLLGALSFVRFRTPVKDPSEIGFLLVLIATSIGAATGNLFAIIILLTLIFLILLIQHKVTNRGNFLGRGHLIIAMDKQSFSILDKKVNEYLSSRLKGLTLETMSTIDNRVSLNYQYKKQSNFDWVSFTGELNKIAGQEKLEIFIS